MTETFRCPSCGAPLQLLQPDQHNSICLYCNSNVRVTHSPDDAAPTVEASDLPAETIERIKQHLTEGHQDEAIRIYQEATGATDEEAQTTIKALARELVVGVILGQRLKPVGVLMVVALIGLNATILAAGITGNLGWPWVVIGSVAGILLLIPWLRGIAVTFRYLGSNAAPAMVLRLARIGDVRGISTFRVALQVQPLNQATFESEISLPVRPASIGRLHPGTMLQVRYLPGDPRSVIFDKGLD
jgi:hypothetical protein